MTSLSEHKAGRLTHWRNAEMEPKIERAIISIQSSAEQLAAAAKRTLNARKDHTRKQAVEDMLAWKVNLDRRFEELK